MTDTMPCGHPASDVVSSDEGTSYCYGCATDAEAQRQPPQTVDQNDLWALLMCAAHHMPVMTAWELAATYADGLDVYQLRVLATAFASEPGEMAAKASKAIRRIAEERV